MTRSRLHSLLVLLITVAGALLRIRELQMPLWRDEAWVANSILSPTWHEMFFYPHYLQTTPPLLLAVVRAVVHVAGISDLAFRLVPLLCGIALIPLTYQLVRRLAGDPAGLFAAALTALSTFPVQYAGQLKQYSTDPVVTVVLLLLLLRAMDSTASKTSWAFWCAASATAIAPWFSYGALLLLPAALLALACLPAASLRERWTRWLIASGLSGVSAAWLYFGFIVPNRNADLVTYWAAHFPPSAVSAWPAYLLSRVLLMMRTLHPAGTAIQLLLLGLGLTGVVAISKKQQECSKQNKSFLLLALGLPVPVAFAANLAHVYPLGAARVQIYLFPLLVLAVSAGLAWLLRPLKAEWLGVAATLAVGVLTVRAELRPYEPRPEYVAVPQAFAVIQAHGKESDAVYVHGLLTYQAEFYRRRFALPPKTWISGDTDRPCCVREARPFADPTAPEITQKHALEAQKTRQNASFWMIFDTLHAPSAPQAILDANSACSDRRAWHWQGVTLLRIGCAAPPGPGPAGEHQ